MPELSAEEAVRFFGWRGDLPVCTHLRDRHEAARRTSDALAAAVYERALSAAERGELAEVMARADAAAVG